MESLLLSELPSRGLMDRSVIREFDRGWLDLTVLARGSTDPLFKAQTDGVIGRSTSDDLRLTSMPNWYYVRSVSSASYRDREDPRPPTFVRCDHPGVTYRR